MREKTNPTADDDREQALEQTFPASDAVSTNQADKTAVRPLDRKPALIDQSLVDELADKVADHHAESKT